MKIAISYRDESWGKAAFFDHFTLREMTKSETVICTSNKVSTVKFANYIHLRVGDKKKYSLPINPDMPQVVDDWAANSGFVYIPGYTRDSDNKQPVEHKERMSFEQKLINKARLRGQPVLAICAGSWTLWENYGGKTKEVKDHNYGGAMPRLSTAGPRVCNNKMIHQVVPVKGTYLSGISKGTNPFSVNSVHWKAPDPNSPDAISLLEVSANSKKAPHLAPNSRQGKKMEPENCVEGFESKNGAPMIGIQWHPEAFNPSNVNAKKHQAIFTFMADAGQTYLNRRALNREFKDKVSQNKISFFVDKHKQSVDSLVRDTANLRIV